MPAAIKQANEMMELPARGGLPTQADALMAALGIVRGTQFTAAFGRERISALLGSDYGDVPRGDWVALIERDERDSTRTYLQLAISFGNAATEIGCAVGDTLYIEQP